jgi:hypothetical protein
MSSPAGISCGSDCSQTYSAGTVVTLSHAAKERSLCVLGVTACPERAFTLATRSAAPPPAGS